MIETKNLILRNASFADLDRFAEWESRENVIRHFCIDGKRDLDTLTKVFHQVTKDDSQRWLTIVYKGSMKPIGRVGITCIDPINDSMDLTIVYIADDEMRGRGFGEETIRGVLELAFTEMNMHRVTLDHFLDDKVSSHLYDKIGFRKEGIMKSAGRQGNEYNDLQLRAMLKEEWEEQVEMAELAGQEA
ncbi:MAG: GNAT family N-acetyltransferase [Mogibacterium sp.]|nr:GNAT family N-acetyltransferase [Mogibacterium sp.]